MSSYLCFVDDIPPSDRMWLVSTLGDLQTDEANEKECTDRWLKAHPFPGCDASYEAKVAWLAAVQKECTDEKERSGFNWTLVPDAFEICSEVLLKEAPDRIIVEVHVNVKDLDKVKDLTDSQKKQFASGLKTHGCDQYKGEANWEAYKAFLLENAYGPEDRTVLGKIECSKDDKLGDSCRNFTRNLGIYDFVYGFMEVSRSSWAACSDWGLMPLVGNNLYYPLPDKRMVYPVLIMRIATPTDAKKAATEFVNSLEAIQEATKATDAPKTYTLVPKKEAAERYGTEEEPPLSAENYHVLWLPHQYDEELDRVKPHFQWGKGECRQIQKRLDKGNTDSGNLRVEIFHNEFQFIKQLTFWQTKFCAALALTNVAAEEPFWADDNECPDEVAKMIKDLATYWRLTLLKKDDKTLGLGLGSIDEENVDVFGMSDSRMALYRLLEITRDQFEKKGDSDFKIKFNYQLGHSRNPKTRNAQNKKRKVEEK